MKMRFPAFVNVDDDSIEFAVEEAVVACGDTAGQNNSDWIDDANLTLALMYYSAHLLQMSLMRAGSGGTGMVISSERTPELSVTYQAPPYPDLSKPIDLTQTIYGVRFLGLVKKNFPAILVVNSAIRF
jgi:hypothetical protein